MVQRLLSATLLSLVVCGIAWATGADRPAAQKQGLSTASQYWPGTQAEIRGVRPTYWQLFDTSVSPNARVEQVLTWLEEGTTAEAVSLRQEQTHSGHSVSGR